ncbi:MAG: hypothetical protein HDT26_01785 [Subdoligranulum sp.]|nr:hypothetical protein [Subdoligranulum sp.]
MAAKNLYSTREKEKQLYGGSGTVNAGTQSTPQSTLQSNEWDTGQSTQRLQSSAQKSKREKTPSELGEEVLRLMLEEDMPKLRQPAAKEKAVDQARTGAEIPTAKAESGNKRAVPYSSSTTIPYSGAATTPYGGAGIGSGADWDRSPVYLPSTLYGSAAAQPLANAEAGANDIRGTRWGDDLTASLRAFGARNDPSYTTPLQALGAAADPTYTTPLQALGAAADPSYTVPAWQWLEDAQRLTNTETNANTQFASNRQSLAAAWNLYEPELVTVEQHFDFLPENGTKRLWEDTHIAEGLSSPLYGSEKGLSGAVMDLRGTWNRAATQSWENAGNGNLGYLFPSNYIPLPMFENSAAAQGNKQDLSNIIFPPMVNHAPNAANIQEHEIEVQNAESDLVKPENDETAPESEALPDKRRSDILNNKSDSKKHAPEWWEVSGASETVDPNHPTYQAMNAELTDNDRAAGLSVVKIDGEYYIDYTTVINARLHEVEQEFRNHSIYNPRLAGANIAWFVSQVKGEGPWDIKVKDSWKMQFGNVRPLSRMDDTIAYNGQVVQPENLGNLTYGYLGSAMGWPAEILYLGAGAYNQKELADLAKKEGEQWAWLNIFNPFVYTDGSYGDGENDIPFIRQGVELYDAVH